MGQSALVVNCGCGDDEKTGGKKFKKLDGNEYELAFVEVDKIITIIVSSDDKSWSAKVKEEDFGDSEINIDKFKKKLAQYIRSKRWNVKKTGEDINLILGQDDFDFQLKLD